MYQPAAFVQSDLAALHGLIDLHPLGLWITTDDDAPEAAPGADALPFLLDAERGPRGTLLTHVARANPLWQRFSRSRPSRVVFQAEQGYVSPGWYPSKQQHGKAVPTWNYTVVQAQGRPQVIEDRGWLRAFLERLTARHEQDQPRPWRLDDAPAEYLEQMLGAIVGIEIPIDRLEGKWKLSQNRPQADKLGVVEGLQSNGDAASLALAQRIRSTF